MKQTADSNFLHIVEVDYEWKEGLDIWPLPLYWARGALQQTLAKIEDTLSLGNDQKIQIDSEWRGTYMK